MPKVSFQFHVKPASAQRSHREADNTERLEWDSEGTVPVPNVGDTVSYQSWKRTGPGATDGEDITVTRKVVSRHFLIMPDHINVSLDVSES